MRSLHEAFETVLQFLEVAAGEPARLSSPLALAAVRTLGRCVCMVLEPFQYAPHVYRIALFGVCIYCRYLALDLFSNQT